MKSMFLPALLLASSSAFGQATVAPDSLFIVTYTTGPAWDSSKPPGEQPYFKDHSASLGKMRKEGIIRLGGRFAEKGIIIISATSAAAAKELIFNDPAVVNKLFTAEMQRLHVFYYGCLEKPK